MSETPTPGSVDSPLPAPPIAPFDTIEFGARYQDVLGPTMQGICTHITYHYTGCTTVTVFDDPKARGATEEPTNYELSATRIAGFTGDPEKHSPEAAALLGTMAKHKHLKVGLKYLAGLVIGFSHSHFSSDAVLIQYVLKSGEVESRWFDVGVMTLDPKKLDPAKKITELIDEAAKTAKTVRRPGAGVATGPNRTRSFS